MTTSLGKDVVSSSSDAVHAHADELHKKAIVINGQGVTIVDPSIGLSGGLTAVVITLAHRLHEDFMFTIKAIEKQLSFLRFYADKALLVTSAADIDLAKESGRLGIIFGMQSTNPIGTDAGLISVLRALGLRVGQLTYMEDTPAGSGCLEPHDRGLTAFGRQIIRALERENVILDLSHVGRKTTLDALSYAEKPTIISHSNVAALHEHPRNVTDEEIRAVADTGGFVGIVSAPAFFRSDGSEGTVADIVDHIEYVAEHVGTDHVAVATDQTEGVSPLTFASGTHATYAQSMGVASLSTLRATGLASQADFPNVTYELCKRGFSDEDILKILGGNWMRVARAVWGD